MADPLQVHTGSPTTPRHGRPLLVVPAPVTCQPPALLDPDFPRKAADLAALVCTLSCLFLDPVVLLLSTIHVASLSLALDPGIWSTDLS